MFFKKITRSLSSIFSGLKNRARTSRSNINLLDPKPSIDYRTLPGYALGRDDALLSFVMAPAKESSRIASLKGYRMGYEAGAKELRAELRAQVDQIMNSPGVRPIASVKKSSGTMELFPELSISRTDFETAELFRFKARERAFSKEGNKIEKIFRRMLGQEKAAFQKNMLEEVWGHEASAFPNVKFDRRGSLEERLRFNDLLTKRFEKWVNETEVIGSIHRTEMDEISGRMYSQISRERQSILHAMEAAAPKQQSFPKVHMDTYPDGVDPRTYAAELERRAHNRKMSALKKEQVTKDIIEAHGQIERQKSQFNTPHQRISLRKNRGSRRKPSGGQ